MATVTCTYASIVWHATDRNPFESCSEMYISRLQKKDDHSTKVENIIVDEKLVEFFTLRYLSVTFVLGRKKICKTLDFSYFYNGKSVVIYMKKETLNKIDYFVIIRGISCFNGFKIKYKLVKIVCSYR